MTIDEALKAGMAMHQAGSLAEAERIYRHILAAQPHHADAIHLLGVIAAQNGQREPAVELMSRAVALRPESAEFRCNLGAALLELNRKEEAAAELRRAIDLRPNMAQAHNNLGNALTALGRHQEAADCARRALALDPNYAQAYYNLANVQRNLGQWDEAVANYRRALALKRDWREAENNLGNTFCSAGRFAEAENLFADVLARRPDDPLAHWNVALALLRRGDLERGLKEYESRWQIPELRLNRLRDARPEWDGGEIKGRRILVYAEQGLGDSIQFARYIPFLAGRGAGVVVNCQKELAGLLGGIAGVTECHAHPGAKNSRWDLHCSLPSLPRLMGTTLATIPASVPYLRADPAKAALWRNRLEGTGKRKIGVAWAGSPRHPSDEQRSVRLDRLADLWRSDIRMVSLQKGQGREQIGPSGLALDDWTEELDDFADTAALVENLDLIVTVDTAVAHLAGAMGKEVWVLLPFVPDWRWMLEREDSPWYPTMRLFRQEKTGDWSGPIGRIAEALGSP
jgi:tetratricopeptide (TPR) repeat protein